MLTRGKNEKIHTFRQWLHITIFLIAVTVFGILGLGAYRHKAAKLTETGSVATTETEPATIQSNSPQAKIVCLDPGHGGQDAGAISGVIHESDLNLAVALQTKLILENENYKVYLTRTDDTGVAKRDRATYCNSVKGDIFVSIHHNSYDTDRTVDYGTALYYKDSDQLLASSILSSTSASLGIKSQGIAKFDDSLLWVAKMPAALSEAFFITNKSEKSLLSDTGSVRLANEAKGIADGITNYFTHPEQIQTSISSDSLIIDRADLGD